MQELAKEQDDCDFREECRIIRAAAIGLLARREHSQLELHQKLSKRFPDLLDLFDSVFKVLVNDGLQSDLRFSEAYIRMRYGRGYGASRISQELLQRGVAAEVVQHCMDAGGYDWYALACDVLDKKFSCSLRDFTQKSKAQRFLYYRGFDSEQISEALRISG